MTDFPPRPVFTCRCGRYFLDMFSFGKHRDECQGVFP